MVQAFPRTFICIPITDRIRASLVAIQNHVRQVAPRLTLTHAEDAHVTLAFLGESTAARTSLVCEGMDRICAGYSPFLLPVGGGGYFGPHHSPKVIWAGVRPPEEMLRLRQALVQMVEQSGFTLETRPFNPHLTIARIRSRLPPPALTSIMSYINNTHFAEIPVDRVLFMNSLLNGPGPRYKTIHQALLKGH